jgi:hypothetical protein
MSSKLLSWNDYLDAMRTAGDLMNRAWIPNDEQYRADLYRQLMMNIGYAYFGFFQSNERHPDFMPIWNSVFMLQPNPDDAYLYAPLDGNLRYRVVADRGTIYRISFTIGRELIGFSDTPGPAYDYFELDESIVGPDGRFEIVFSSKKPVGYTGSWRYLDPRADYIIIRQRSCDWGAEVDSRFAIECLDAPELKRQMSVEEIADRLDRLVKVPERWSKFWIDWTHDLQKRIGRNAFETNASFAQFGSIPNQVYLQGLFEMEPGEALILETELPKVRPYWNFQVNDPVFNAIDIVYRQTSLNGHTARIDADGRFRAVVCREDPGVPNWLDTGGYLQGSFIGRWQGCDSAPIPALTRVPLAELRQHLPADTPSVSEAERAESLRRRRLGGQMRRRW